MEDLRIIFMGTPDFAVATLKALLNNKYNVVGVITAADKPAGRGRKIRQSAVKQFAVENNLNVLQPTNLKNEDFIKTLQSLNANLQIVVAFRMLPKIVWNMPKYGTFNLHASLLPDYRGAAPINWAIINGETKTGVSTFFLDEKIDTGAIIMQKEVQILPKETAGILHDKLMSVGSNLVIDTVKSIENNTLKLLSQPENESKPAPKLNKENCKINWNNSTKNIFNLIRGLSPYPAAWTIINNNDNIIEVKIYNAEIIKEDHSYEIGKIITTKKELKIVVSDGYLKIIEIKLAGKRKMDVQSLLNGYTFFENAKVL
ncbi:MAG: methionyl-tRNA formyltransferase [Bacteroidota bacterium]